MNVDPLLSTLTLEQLCGQLLVVGFDGHELPATLAAALRSGLRGGVILFRRNLPDLSSTWRLCRSIHSTFPNGVAPFIGIDEEGGRVTRLPSPFRALPAMRALGQLDTEHTRACGRWLGERLACLGINCDFAPVLDVDSNPSNPVIGDRSFSFDPATVASHGLAFIEGIQSAGVAACGKHFPGHGDTSLDSHYALPIVRRSSAELESTELLPFRRCSQSALAALMTAHVVYPELEPKGLPASFSARILVDLLRERLGFSGVVFSDDLEMGAISEHWSVETAACSAIQAGCDVLLVCQDSAAAERALEALVERARNDELFFRRITSSSRSFLRLRTRFEPKPVQTEDELSTYF